MRCRTGWLLQDDVVVPVLHCARRDHLVLPEFKRRYSLAFVNIGVCASYWRFIEAPGGADKAQL